MASNTPARSSQITMPCSQIMHGMMDGRSRHGNRCRSACLSLAPLHWMRHASRELWMLSVALQCPLSKGIEVCLQLIWQRCGDLGSIWQHHLNRMEPEPPGRAPDRVSAAASIPPIPHHTVTNAMQMAANLVLSAGLWVHFQQGGRAKRFPPSVPGTGIHVTTATCVF